MSESRVVILTCCVNNRETGAETYYGEKTQKDYVKKSSFFFFKPKKYCRSHSLRPAV
jgi:hypothetical protein